MKKKKFTKEQLAMQERIEQFNAVMLRTLRIEAEELWLFRPMLARAVVELYLARKPKRKAAK